jgi:hypothetical protein
MVWPICIDTDILLGSVLHGVAARAYMAAPCGSAVWQMCTPISVVPARARRRCVATSNNVCVGLIEYSRGRNARTWFAFESIQHQLLRSELPQKHEHEHSLYTHVHNA